MGSASGPQNSDSTQHAELIMARLEAKKKGSCRNFLNVSRTPAQSSTYSGYSTRRQTGTLGKVPRLLPGTVPGSEYIKDYDDPDDWAEQVSGEALQSFKLYSRPSRKKRGPFDASAGT